MKLYKKMVRFYSIYSYGMGFKDKITFITDWLEEDEINDEVKKKIEEILAMPFTTVQQKVNYIFVKEEN